MLHAIPLNDGHLRLICPDAKRRDLYQKNHSRRKCTSFHGVTASGYWILRHTQLNRPLMVRNTPIVGGFVDPQELLEKTSTVHEKCVKSGHPQHLQKKINRKTARIRSKTYIMIWSMWLLRCSDLFLRFRLLDNPQAYACSTKRLKCNKLRNTYYMPYCYPDNFEKYSCFVPWSCDNSQVRASAFDQESSLLTRWTGNICKHTDTVCTLYTLC